MIGYAASVYAFMWWYFSWRNRQRRDGKEDSAIDGMSEHEIAELGDRDPRFRYAV